MKTTEFWIAVLTGLWLFLNSAGIIDTIPNKYAAIGLAVVSALYAVARGIAKQGDRPDPLVPANDNFFALGETRPVKPPVTATTPQARR